VGVESVTPPLTHDIAETATSAERIHTAALRVVLMNRLLIRRPSATRLA